MTERPRSRRPATTAKLVAAANGAPLGVVTLNGHSQSGAATGSLAQPLLADWLAPARPLNDASPNGGPLRKPVAKASPAKASPAKASPAKASPAKARLRPRQARPRQARSRQVGRRPVRRRTGRAKAGAAAATPINATSPAAMAPAKAESAVASGIGPAKATAKAAAVLAGDRRKPDQWDQRVAGALGFLRRRLTGQYEVDEFGFDPQLTEALVHPLLRLLYQRLLPGRGERGGEPATGRRGAPGRQPFRHRADGRTDAQHGGARRDPVPPAPAAARRRPRVPRSGAVGAGPQGRLDAGLQSGRGAAAAGRRVRRRVPGRLQGHRQAVPGSVQVAAVRPGRVRLRRAADVHPDRARVDRRVPRRSTPSWPTSSRWRGSPACPTCR